jgi:hypothetical protein
MRVQGCPQTLTTGLVLRGEEHGVEAIPRRPLNFLMEFRFASRFAFRSGSAGRCAGWY